MSSTSETMILELREVAFSYRSGTALVKDLSFAVGEGEFIGLLGANGSGKSTMLKLCCGILKPSRGNVLLWGKPLHSYKNRDRAKLISYLPQALGPGVPFTVKELVSMGLYPYDIPPSMTAEDALDMVGLIDKADSYLTDLSGGEMRRTFIAMTLLQGAGLLLLDEPLANLDVRYQAELLMLLKKLREERKISVVMALHDINMAFQFAKVMLIKGGVMLGIGDPSEVLTDTNLREAFEIGLQVRKAEDGGAYMRYPDKFS